MKVQAYLLFAFYCILGKRNYPSHFWIYGRSLLYEIQDISINGKEVNEHQVKVNLSIGKILAESFETKISSFMIKKANYLQGEISDSRIFIKDLPIILTIQNIDYDEIIDHCAFSLSLLKGQIGESVCIGEKGKIVAKFRLLFRCLTHTGVNCAIVQPQGYESDNIGALKCGKDSCLNGGKCIFSDFANEARCKCSENFEGNFCEKVSNVEISVKQNQKYTKLSSKVCALGFTGSNCDIATCQNYDGCGNNCNCIISQNQHVCLCQQAADDNQIFVRCNNPCINGVCMNFNQNQASCKCDPGFFGEDCSINERDYLSAYGSSRNAFGAQIYVILAATIAAVFIFCTVVILIQSYVGIKGEASSSKKIMTAALTIMTNRDPEQGLMQTNMMEQPQQMNYNDSVYYETPYESYEAIEAVYDSID